VDANILRAVPLSPVRPAYGPDAEDLVTAAFGAHRDELFTFLSRATRNDSEAEDLLQETFLRLAREVRAERVPDQVRAWLYRVAANLATSRFRRRAVVRRWLETFGASEHDPGQAGSPETAIRGRERHAEMERAMGTVSADARLALLMSAQGFSGREIAQSVGRSELATRAMMSRARIRVRAALEDSER
jgi:RNA polymerase sigma-70 factor, ECF subfamily